MSDRLSEIRRRFVEGLLVGMQPTDLQNYVNGQDMDEEGPVGF